MADIHGKPMFWHVYRRATQCPELSHVTLATDDQRIYRAADELEVPVVMTRPDHASGTDRVLEAAGIVGIPDNTVVVNIQGDEPLLAPDMLTQLLRPFADPAVQVTTLARGIDPVEANREDVVKVVFTASRKALYFSRSPVPFNREKQLARYFGHIGLYAFRMETLKRFVALSPSGLEKTEKLEQLRLLENDIPIHVSITEHHNISVDRPEDLETVKGLLLKRINEK